MPAPLVTQNASARSTPTVPTGARKHFDSPAAQPLVISPISVEPTSESHRTAVISSNEIGHTNAGVLLNPNRDQQQTTSSAARTSVKSDASVAAVTASSPKGATEAQHFFIGSIVAIRTSRSGSLLDGTVLSVNGNSTLTVNVRKDGRSWVEVCSTMFFKNKRGGEEVTFCCDFSFVSSPVGREC